MPLPALGTTAERATGEAEAPPLPELLLRDEALVPLLLEPLAIALAAALLEPACPFFLLLRCRFTFCFSLILGCGIKPSCPPWASC